VPQSAASANHWQKASSPHAKKLWPDVKSVHP
jgi:hypothetical protein